MASDQNVSFDERESIHADYPGHRSWIGFSIILAAFITSVAFAVNDAIALAVFITTITVVCVVLGFYQKRSFVLMTDHLYVQSARKEKRCYSLSDALYWSSRPRCFLVEFHGGELVIIMKSRATKTLIDTIKNRTDLFAVHADQAPDGSAIRKLIEKERRICGVCWILQPVMWFLMRWVASSADDLALTEFFTYVGKISLIFAPVGIYMWLRPSAALNSGKDRCTHEVPT